MDELNRAGMKLYPADRTKYIPTPHPGDIVTACPLYCFIRLSNGMVATVDPDVWIKLHKYTWHARKGNGGWYAHRAIETRGRRRYLSMHREIMNTPKVLHVHHKNGLTLFNVKENLKHIDPIAHATLTQFRKKQRRN